MKKLLDIDLLRSFVAVAEARSFTRAAARLSRVQSAVSMQIKRLEETLERRLFERDARTVTLTSDGEAMLGHARRMLSLNNEVLEDMSRPAMAGSARVGASDVASYLLPLILPRFAVAYPSLRLEISCERSWTLLDQLDAGELDIALVTQAGERKDGRLIRREPLVWATARGHLAHENDPVPLALFGPGCIYREQAIAAMDAAGKRWRLAYSSVNQSGLTAAVEAGLAVTTAVHSTLQPGTRVLGPAEGFPPLPNIEVLMFARPGALADGIAREIVQAVESEARYPA